MKKTMSIIYQALVYFPCQPCKKLVKMPRTRAGQDDCDYGIKCLELLDKNKKWPYYLSISLNT